MESHKAKMAKDVYFRVYLCAEMLKQNGFIEEIDYFTYKITKQGKNLLERAKYRQIKELGKEIEITGYVATVENFFEMKGAKYHEIMFIYKAEFVNDEDKKTEDTLQNIEGKDYLQYEWIDLNKINEYPLRPNVLKEVLKENEFPVHKINID